MPRTLPAELTTAMDSGSYDPYLKVRLFVDDDSDYDLADVLYFKIEDVKAECIIPYDATLLGSLYFAIERGVLVAGVPVTIRTVYYTITSMLVGPQGIHLSGHILPPAFATVPGFDWYMNIINHFIGSGGFIWDQNIVYESDVAPWLSYWFYPEGKTLNLGNMQNLFNLLAQKYLIFVAENCDGMFIFQATVVRAKDYDVTDELLSRETQTSSRRFIWRDQNNLIHYSGGLNDPLHNFGYIDSIEGAPPTNTPSPRTFHSSKLPVHLKYRTGDVVKLGTATNYFQGRIKVTEVFDIKANPSWHVILEPLVWFTNTAGGAIPSTIEAAAPYVPVGAIGFSNVLSSADNNIQTAMDTLDGHNHLALVTAAPTVAIAGKSEAYDTVGHRYYVWDGIAWHGV